MGISNVRHLLVGSGIRRQPERKKKTHHLTFSMAPNYCLFHSGGFVLVPLHFHLAEDQSGYTTRGYISGTAFAESLTALLDGDDFTLGRGKAVALQVMALCAWTATLILSFLVLFFLLTFINFLFFLDRPF
jgi:hypothetical protein